MSSIKLLDITEIWNVVKQILDKIKAEDAETEKQIRQARRRKKLQDAFKGNKENLEND